MSFEIREINVKSTDNIHNLCGKIYIPQDNIKGLFQIVHGMTEHIERYDGVMTALAQKGYIVFAHDHLGHGKTAKDDNELGFIAHIDGWKYLVNDVKAVGDAIKKLYPQLPLYLFGHSMGSFIVRLAASAHPEDYEKLIICGTSGKNPIAFAGLTLTNVIKAFKGEKYISPLVLNTAFGAYNKRFEPITRYEWLTKDRGVIEKYSKDKYCTFSFTVSAMHDLITLCHECNKTKWFNNISNKLPILLISGTDDPVGNYGKGVTEVYNRLIQAGAVVKIKLYDNCRHEILNDDCRDEVVFDILEFIK